MSGRADLVVRARLDDRGRGAEAGAIIGERVILVRVEWFGYSG